MTESQVRKLRERIAEMEQEMMEFRISMAAVLMELHATVHELERQQRWSKPDNMAQLKTLRDCIITHFNRSEFEGLCFDLGVNVDSLDGGTVNDLARELVLLFNRTGRCESLMSYCREKRPNAVFP